VATNIAFDQVLLQAPTSERMALRRSLNSQRRYLAEHAELLAVVIPALTTDIDYTFIARAFDAVGDLDRAQRHWKQSVEKSRPLALGRWYRRAGRACLLAAAFSGGVEIFNAGQGDGLPPVTLCSVFSLSPNVTAPSVASLKAVIEIVVDSPLWISLPVAAAIPYALAIHRFFKEKTAREEVAPRRVRTVL
jgi:hypothetical protein